MKIEDLPPLKVAVLHRSSEAGQQVVHGKRRASPKQPQTDSTLIYDGLAMVYNDAVIGALIFVNLPNKPTVGNLHRVLAGRGLKRDEDYLLYKAKHDVDGNRFPVKERPTVIEKVTDSVFKVSPSHVGLSRSLAAQALKDGQEDQSLLHAREALAGENRGAAELHRTKNVAAALIGTHTPLDDVLHQAGQLLSGEPVVKPEVPPAPAVLDQAEAAELASRELPALQIGQASG